MKRVILNKAAYGLLILGMTLGLLSFHFGLLTAYAATPASENFDSADASQQDGSPRIIGDWTYAVLKVDGNHDAGAYLDILDTPSSSPLISSAADHAIAVTGYYNATEPTECGKIIQIKSTSGEEFKLESFHIDGIGHGLTIIGYRGDSIVATKDITAPDKTDTLVSFSGTEGEEHWENIDEFRIERQDGVADLPVCYFDDILVSAPVTPDTQAPSLQSAVRTDNTHITAGLSEECANLTKANDGGFTVAETGAPGTTYAVSGIAQGADASHVILTVADMGVSAKEGVTVKYTAGGNGTVADTAGNAMATDGTGVSVTGWDTTPPTVNSINRNNPADADTNAASVVYRVTFDEAVTGVDVSDFTLTTSGTAIGTVASVSTASATAIDVTVNTISGVGTIRLDLKASGTGIEDIGGMAIATGYTSGQTYTIDTQAPSLQSAVRTDNTHITAGLSEECANLTKANDGGFTVAETGAPGTTYDVSGIAQGADASHVILTVADMGVSAKEGVTVKYTAGGNGTVADTAGNAMATDGTGVSVTGWDTTPPTVNSINRNNPADADTNAASVVYRVTFDEAVTGVDVSDFTLTTSGTAIGTVASVSTASATAIDVTVNTISGVGTIRLDLKASGTGIEDIGGMAIATGYTSGQTYTIDTQAPSLQSAVRTDNTHITAGLSEECTNLTKANDGGFTVAETGAPGTTYDVSGITQGADASHVILTVADMGVSAKEGVTVKYTAGGNGTVADTAGNAMATDGTGVSVTGWDTTPPTVNSINRNNPADADTNAASVVYRVTFDEAVTGVDVSDFTLTTSGTAIGTVASVSTASATAIDVTVNTISGVGTIRLDLKASGTGIEDIGGTAIATGYTSGQTYTIDTQAPSLQSAVRTDNTHITAGLSEECANLTKANDGGFTVAETGAPGTTYDVSGITQGADASHVILTVADMGVSAKEGVTVKYTAGGNGTVADTAGNAMATDGTGVSVTGWDTTPPTVNSINRNNPADADTNAASVVYRVTFDEAVTGVDVSDFTLTTSGTAIGTVASVSTASATAIDVTVNTISGVGTIRLDLKASGTGIEDIGGTAIATGYTSGQTYTIDTQAPSLQSAVRTDNTHITAGLSEECANLTKANDGGFTVAETGAPGTTYAVSGITQGADASHVILTVADMGVSAKEGVTVKYTAGGNGTVADTAGNAMATDGTGVSVTGWDTTPPTVNSINRNNPADADTNAASVVYRVTFDEAVTGVDAGDFTLTTSGTAIGTVASVSTASATAIDVTVNTISGVGTIRLDLKASGTGIEDIGGMAIATGYTSGQTYTIDTQAPSLQSAVRTDNTHITAGLSEECANLTKANDGGFTVAETGAPGTTYDVSGITQGADASHVILTVADMGVSAKEGVTVKYTAGGNGTVADTAGNAMATDGTGVSVTGWDTTPPTVNSINRNNPADADTNAASVVYRVTFDEAVTGVDAGDFTLTTSGTAIGTVASVSTASATAIDVTVNTISGVGTIRLDLKASGTGIEDIGGMAIATGYTSGQTYTIDTQAPSLQSAVRTDNTHITAGLSEECANLTKANDGGFTVAETGAPGTTYAVSGITQGADASHVILTVADMGVSAKEGVTVKYTAGGNGTVADTAGNAMATDGTGVSVTGWDTTPPTVSSAALDVNNTYLDIVFSEGIYGADDGTTALTSDKLSLVFAQNAGTATNAAIYSVKRNDNIAETTASALTGGETTIRVFLTISGTPNGSETMRIDPANGAAIYDKAGNAVQTSQTTGTKALNDKTVHSSGGGGGSSNTGSTGTTNSEVIINGQAEYAGTATVETAGDKTILKISVDDKKIEEKLNSEGNHAVVSIPAGRNSDVVIAGLNGQTIKNMESKEAVLEVKTENVNYTIPASEIRIDDVLSEFGDQVELEDIRVNVAIATPQQDTIRIIEEAANKNSYQIVVKPVEFEITCSKGDQSVTVSRFHSYIERTIAIPDGIDVSKITTGIVLNHDGTFSHVPTQVIKVDGKYYAKISSLTNSTYSVIYSPKQFKDVEKHWAREAVNDMASRLAINGVSEDRFAPDQDITRAEFAAIIVRALGLRAADGTGAFHDVKDTAWYSGYVKTATDYEIISGYGDGSFRPKDKITREQAMMMAARAMALTGLKEELNGNDVNQLLGVFSDQKEIASYAKDSIAECIKTGVISGRSSNLIAPKNSITRAESASVIRNLLLKSDLI